MAADVLVIDASVVVKSILAADGLAPLRRFALRVGIRISPEHNVQGALDRLAAASIEAHESAGLVREAVALARQLGWAKTYDAEYVLLARSLGAPFTTLDAKLSRTLGTTVEFVDLSTLDPA